MLALSSIFSILSPLKWALLGGALLTSFSAGGWTVYKVMKAGEVHELNKTIRNMSKVYASDMTAQETRHKHELERAGERVQIKEVIRHVKDSRSCDVAADVAGVLDARLQGTALGTDAGAGTTTAPVAVSQRQILHALDDIGERLNACRDIVIEWNERIAARNKLLRH